MHRVAIISLAFLGICIGCSGSSSESDPGTPPSTAGNAPVTSTAVAYPDVQAIFDKNCVGCHGATAPKDGIDLTGHAGVMKGGEDGAVVTAGDPDNSILIQALRGTNGKKKMPLNAPPLAEDEIKKIENWIKDGAKA